MKMIGYQRIDVDLDDDNEFSRNFDLYSSFQKKKFFGL